MRWSYRSWIAVEAGVSERGSNEAFGYDEVLQGGSVSTPQYQAAYNRGYITHQMSLAAVERDVGV